MQSPTKSTRPLEFVPAISGYQITDRLYCGVRTAVYRAIHNDLQQSVVVKVLGHDYPTFQDLMQFRNQYTITKALTIPGLVRSYSLEPCGNSYALVMEDCGGISLQTYCQTHNLPWTETLLIAIQLADILHGLHQSRVIHKDIKPANILIHPETKQVKLIDFSISSLLPKETQELQSPNILEGTIAYISPEQTGRMNRGVDYRTDFYALGVTLYQLLTGQLPFRSDNPLEVIHSHIAQVPLPIAQVKADVPVMVGAIVAKLMAKNAEDRYQSALGLKHDLQHCLNQWQAHNNIPSFPLGQRDLSDRFNIPEQLYGRALEVTTLLNAFERVAAGASELMLVAGFSGIGKTAVVNEVHKPITRQQGYFIKGKFDQFNRNIPFSAFVQAFRNLVGYLLSESDHQLAQWKTQILQAVGDSGQVLIEVIPELADLIGVQPPAPELSGTAAQNRFNHLFQQFIQVFTSADHPLVIFLDDLQWADMASLQLMQVLMGDSHHLLIVGAYRDNEVSPVHPLMLTLETLQQAATVVNTIVLRPLTLADTNQLVADTLHCPTELALPLTQLIDRKTRGNPFFTTQFLKALYEDGYIIFNYDRRHWECDIAKINALALTDDVVEFMALQLQKLPEATQSILKLAACVGNQFDLETLAIISEQSPNNVAIALWRALQEGLVLPSSQIYKFFQTEELAESEQHQAINPTYRFFHDRIQQASYSLIPEALQQVTHWKIGQLLLTVKSKKAQSEQIFDIVNQLNLGQSIIHDLDQQYHLARLNLQAGQKAKLSAAYQAAQDYCEIGINILPEAAWQVDYPLTYNLHRNAAEAAYLCSHFDRAEALYEITLKQAQSVLDRAVIYRVQMTQYQLQGRNAEAIAIQRQSLHLLGWTIPMDPADIQASLDQEIATVNQFLEQHRIESILALPHMVDGGTAEMLRILQILFYAAWLDGQSTLALLSLAKMTTLSLHYGNSDMSPFGYVGYGLIANALLKNAHQAYQFGDVAVQLCEQFDNADVRGMTNFLFAADVRSWSCPIREADPYYENALKYGMDAGNWLTVSFMMMLSGSDRLTHGKNLDELYAIAQTHAEFLRNIKSLENLDALMVGVLQPIRHLLGLTHDPLSFDDDVFSEAAYLEKYQDTPYHLAWFYSVKIRHAYLFDQQTTYPALIPQLRIITETVPSHAKVPSSTFYVALMHLALIETTQDEAEQQLHWQAVSALEDQLNQWQQDCAANIQHKCSLIQAEKARLHGQQAMAIDCYERSIAQAQAQGYGYEAALANELAAKFYLSWGKEKVAAGYMQEAYYGYAHWGAKAKVNDLEHRYLQLLTPILKPAATSVNPIETLSAITNATYTLSTAQQSSSLSINTTLDLAAVIQASQSLASTIELNELLQKLTQVILQYSGGDYCALIVPDQGVWQLRAIATPQSVVLQSIALDDCPQLPQPLIQYVKNTQSPAVINDGQTDLPIALPRLESGWQQPWPKSVLCLPILNQAQLVGILYLSNQVTSDVFTNNRLLVLNFLCTQAAISLENARLYQQAQVYAQQLQQSQLQIVQNEKMASLGNLVAGVAHEINNPTGFLRGSLKNLADSFQDLWSHLECYQHHYPNPVPAITEHAEAIELEFLGEDVPAILASMQGATDRIKGISTSLRTFSRADTEYKVSANLHDGLNSTLLILKYRLKASDSRPAIDVIQDYGSVPAIDCFPGQLNQVFMNLLANAIDMFDELAQGSTSESLAARSPQIAISTRVVDRQVEIKIRDNGKGISEELQARIFDHTFTTKPVGKGTGLGLAIAQQIVVEKHGGTLEVRSELGQGSEFVIRLPIDAAR